jgi:hypothetical protein
MNDTIYDDRTFTVTPTEIRAKGFIAVLAFLVIALIDAGIYAFTSRDGREG